MNLYADHILDHYRNPRNRGPIERAQYRARQFNALCGDEIEVFLNADPDGVITAMQFVNQGCAISTAAASMLTEYARGHALEEVAALTDDAFLATLDLAPTPGRRQCALLGLAAFRKSIRE